MAARDPDTGQFVSGGGGGALPAYGETRTVVGMLSTEIPAADLGGGQTRADAEADGNLEIIDFDQVLVQEGEVFEVLFANWTAALKIHTTNTAEAYAELDYTVGTDLEQDDRTSGPFFVSSVDIGNNIDATNGSGREESALWRGRLFSSNQFGDSTNGLGAGMDADRERRQFPFGALYGQGPLFDMDDSLYVPHHYDIDNVSDSAVNAGFGLELTGVVHET